MLTAGLTVAGHDVVPVFPTRVVAGAAPAAHATKAFNTSGANRTTDSVGGERATVLLAGDDEDAGAKDFGEFCE